MKKQLISAIVLAGMIGVSGDALASRARDAVMGNGTAGYFNNAGSMYYDSMYNVFYNPAYVNDFKNWAIIEKGVTRSAAPSVNEGGFAASFNDFNVGFFFNRTDAFTLPAGLDTTSASAIRPIDFLIGGDSGIKWGLGFTYASASGDEVGNAIGVASTANKASHLTLRAGISANNFDPYINYRIAGKAETNDANPSDEIKDSDATIGLRYHYGEWTPYAAYRFGESKQEGLTPSTTLHKFNGFLVGVGRDAKIGEGARLVYGIAYGKLSAKHENSGQKVARNVMPVSVAVEGDIASWLTLRAGLEYKLMNKVSGLYGPPAALGTQADDTSARVGATVHANNFDIDWAFGNSAAGAAASSIDSSSFGFDSGTFTNVSLSYKW